MAKIDKENLLYVEQTELLKLQNPRLNNWTNIHEPSDSSIAPNTATVRCETCNTVIEYIIREHMSRDKHTIASYNCIKELQLMATIDISIITIRHICMIMPTVFHTFDPQLNVMVYQIHANKPSMLFPSKMVWWRHVMKWKHFPRYRPFMGGSPVNSPHKSQWGGTLLFSLICA